MATTLNKRKNRLVTRVGELEYTSDDLFFFKNGIYGFEDLKNFILTELPYDDTPEFYRYLQSAEEPSIALIVMKILINPNGESIINYKDLESHLHLRELKLEDVSIFLVTSIHSEAGNQRVSVNAKAPIILAPSLNAGWQVILDNAEYQVKHYLL